MRNKVKFSAIGKVFYYEKNGNIDMDMLKITNAMIRMKKDYWKAFVKLGKFGG